MSDTSDDSSTTERPATDSGGRPPRKAATKTATKTAKKPVKKPARKPAKAGAPRAQARGASDDQQHADRAHEDRQHEPRQHDDHRTDDGAQGGTQRPRPNGTRLAVLAAEQLVGLTGKDFEGIVGLSKAEDGWSVAVEVLEMRRIPSTTDVIAVYEVDVDQDGDLTGYRRLNRFLRGEAGDDR